MQIPRLPLTRDLVLIGGGHSHALVLRRWGMRPLPGVRLTLIDPGSAATYSGMLPGHVAGHYSRRELDIDLVRLARFAGARLILGAAEGIDLQARTVAVPGRPPVAYDICSLDIGVTSDMPGLAGFVDHAMPAKPLGPFAARWARYAASAKAPKVAVIGGGVAGAELCMAMAHGLRARGSEPKARLIDRGAVLDELGASARRKLRAALAENRVEVVENAEIAAIEIGGVRLADGRLIEAEFVVGAAGAAPHDWLVRTGLDLHHGFVKVDATLRSSDPAVFAAGDCAYLAHAPRPKAGVYAVREAPVLFDNLRAALSGGDLRPYRPQKDYLKLVSLGRKSALAEKFGRAASGAVLWWWKDRIDRRFMAQFRDLPQSEAPEVPLTVAEGVCEALGNKPLCGGCGSKLGRGALSSALSALPRRREDVESLPGDDAAVLRTGGVAQVVSTDHLRAVTEDPVLMTRIAAVHSLGDIWAMGAAPQAATATVILPRLSAALQERTLAEIMATAAEVFGAVGADVVGGHSSMGAEMVLGFTVTGLCAGSPITLAGARPGDALILTKPLGSGVILAAEMIGRAEGAWVAACLEMMVQPQDAAAHILSRAHAMTDVTGFGLAGHLWNICAASGVGAQIDPGAVPLMEGALELAKAGIRSTIYGDNRAAVPGLPEDPRTDLLFDPQTAGGLLAAVPETEADRLVQALRNQGLPAARVGRVTEGPPMVRTV